MKAWEQFLTTQEREIGTTAVDKWLRSLRVLRFDACNLYLQARDSFQALWFEEHMRQKVKARLFNPNNKLIKVHLAVANERPSTKVKIAKAPTFQLVNDPLDPHCTFDTLVATAGNELTLKVLQQSPHSFNPIFLHGPLGAGKSHYLMAVAHALAAGGKRVTYVRAKTFTDHVVAAIRAGQMSAFRSAYRSSDCLIIDDVDAFARKSATQEELFHTFNTLHLAGKQLLLSASVAPSNLQYIEPRLVSRFEWGIALPLLLPTQEELAAIVRAKAVRLDCPVAPRTLEFLLATFRSSSTAAVRALEALLLRSHIDNSNPATLPLAAVEELLADLIAEEHDSSLTSDKVLRAAATHYGVPLEDILGKSRSRECVTPRQVAMHLCRHLLALPYMKIGDIFNRDHSTVMSSVRLVQQKLDDGTLAQDYALLKRALG